MDEYATKKDLEGFKEDIKRYMGILAEDFQHKLDFVIDGQEDIKREVREVKEDGTILKQDVADIKVDVKEIRKDLEEHRNNTEVHIQQAKRKRK